MPTREAQLVSTLRELLGVEVGSKHTTPAGAPTQAYLNGPGGLFGVAGLERDVISTRVAPQGLAGMLPAVGTVDTNPMFAYVTGFRDSSGSNPTTVCSDGPVAGPIKTCLQTAQFGRYTYMTAEMEVNRIGQRTNRGEFDDLRFVNDPLALELGGLLFPNVDRSSRALLGSEVLSRFIAVGVAFELKLNRQFYTGNPANNSAGGGYEEFPGIDILYGSNKFDALTNTSCPSLASDVKNFNFGRVDNVALDPDIVTVMTAMTRYIKANARKMNFGACQWVWTMRENLFYELTDVWPCMYATYRCSNRDGANIDPQGYYDVDAAQRLKDDMRNGQYLLIDGAQWPVVLDDGIIEENRSAHPTRIPGGGFTSDIYLHCLSVRSGYPTLYWEYYDYSNPKGTWDAIVDGRVQDYYWTDGGRYLWHAKPPLNWCIQHIAKIEPRIIQRVPHLCGRIQNVVYVPLQHTRDAYPTDYYFINGGVYTPREAPSLYSDWNPTSR